MSAAPQEHSSVVNSSTTFCTVRVRRSHRHFLSFDLVLSSPVPKVVKTGLAFKSQFDSPKSHLLPLTNPPIMPEESNGGANATAIPARKQPKAGTSRSRSSPQPTATTSTGEQNQEGRPTKRARKAINCEPCRNSKLKCDRCVQLAFTC
jgi:hypothetical protein